MKVKFIDHPDLPVTLHDLEENGVLYFQIDSSNWGPALEKICQERGYKNRDEVFISLSPDVSPQSRTFTTGKQIILTTDNEKLNTMLTKFYEEHLHEDEEIRFVLGGKGQFDIRDKEDRWIAITVEEGDLIIVPARMYHRFALGPDSQFIHAMRLFADQPKWEAIPRHPASS